MQSQQQQKNSSGNFGTFGRVASGLVTRAAQAGWQKTALICVLTSLALGAVIYWQYLLPTNEVMEALRKDNAGLNRQIAIAQTVKQTRPAFIEEYRKGKTVYAELRDLLPNNTKLSEVMEVVQETARRKNIRITLFDASTPNVKSAIGNQPPPAQPAPAADGAQPPPADPANPQPEAPQTRTVLNERVIPAQLIGTQSSIKDFLRELATYELIIGVRDIKVTAINKEVSVNMKLIAFDAPPSSALPADPPELRQVVLGTNSTLPFPTKSPLKRSLRTQ